MCTHSVLHVTLHTRCVHRRKPYALARASCANGPTHLLHVVNGGDFGALIHVELFPPCHLRAHISKRIKAVQNKLKGADAHGDIDAPAVSYFDTIIILMYLPPHIII